jgi:hypothetical protein
MVRKATQKRKMTWVVVWGVLAYASVGEVYKSLLPTATSSESPLWAGITVSIICSGVFVYQIKTLAAAKSASRKFEVGAYGALHKHYHG